MVPRIANMCAVGLLAASSAAVGQDGADLILIGGKVVTADPARPTAEAVAIADDRIRAVGSIEQVRRLAGVQTRTVNLHGATIIPGLIDAHVHLLIAPQIIDESSLRAYERTALPTIMSGFLSHGVTTVRSTGDPLPYIVELRDRMNHSADGPRLVVTGPIISSPGGHPATTACRNNPFCRQRVAREPQNEEQARQAVRELAREKVDAVKVVVDDRVPNIPPLTDSMLAAVVNEAHRNRLPVIAHMTVTADVSTATRLIEIGLDEFVHPPYDIATDRAPEVDSGTAKLLKGRNVLVTTTMSVFDAYRDASGAEQASTGGPYTAFRRQPFERLLKLLPLLADAGVTLVVGTDWIDRPNNASDPRLMSGARTLHEMDIFRRAGLTTTAILSAATRDAAQALGLADKIGTIAEGRLADLVILDGDFLEDFSALHRTVAVFKEGRLVHGALPQR